MELRSYWQVVAIACFAVSFLGCSNQAHFGGGGTTRTEQARNAGQTADPADPTPTPTPAPTIPAEQTLEAEESYELSARNQTGKLDIIWTIDNSGSMGDEAAKVRLNFQKFLDSLGSSTDLRLNLISSATLPTGGIDTGVRLDAAALAAGHNQLDITIGSTNLLAIAAAAICPISATDLSNTTTAPAKICNQPLTSTEVSSIETATQATRAREGLVKWLRPDAKKIFVFVTDDNARGVMDTHFLKILQSQKGFESSTVFSFRGTNTVQAGCSISRPGTAYDSLASQTSAEVFDICQPDWSSSFDKLKDHAVLIANSDIELGHDRIVEIVDVKIGTTLLAKADYKLVNKVLTITPQALQGSSGKIVVRYKYRK